MRTRQPQVLGQYIVADPEMCHGQLTFKGTRILVETVLSYLAAGRFIEWVLAEWPRLSRDAVQEALQLATVALVSSGAVERHEPSHT